MKRKLFLFFFVIICLFITGCNKTTNNTQNINNNNAEASITLQADNEYLIISGIDFSECTYEDGYFSGYVYFNSHTTEKYVATYDDYFYRKLYFDIIDITGEIVGTEVAHNNYVYNREYSSQEDFYVTVRSKNQIKEVKLKKIELFMN